MAKDNTELTLELGRQNDGRWYAGEVRVLLPAEQYYDYGTYSFHVKRIQVVDTFTDGLVNKVLPPSVTLGLFTWDDTKNYAIREDFNQEVDIELGRWNIRDNGDVQFLVQPPGNPQMHRFYSGAPPTISLPVYDQAPHDYSFSWNPAKIEWRSTAGGGQTFTYGAQEALREQQPDYTQCMPAQVEVRMNLWNLFGSSKPQGMEDTHAVQVVIDKFEFKPSGEKALPESGICTKDCQCDENSRCLQNRCRASKPPKSTFAAASNGEELTSSSLAWREHRWIVLGGLVSFALAVSMGLYCYYRRLQSERDRDYAVLSKVGGAGSDEEKADESFSSGENDPYRIATEGNLEKFSDELGPLQMETDDGVELSALRSPCLW